MDRNDVLDRTLSFWGNAEGVLNVMELKLSSHDFGPLIAGESPVALWEGPDDT
jgi:hypothetical protein